MTKRKKFKLGDEIIITSKLKRSVRYRDSMAGSPFKQRTKEWEEVSINERKVIVVGLRILSNGYTFFDEGNHYVPEMYFNALLVVGKLSEKPFYILNNY